MGGVRGGIRIQLVHVKNIRKLVIIFLMLALHEDPKDLARKMKTIGSGKGKRH